MPYGLYISAEGAHVQSARLDVIAHNMANVDTVGFKRQLAVFQARNAEAVSRGQSQSGSGSIDDLGGGVMMRETATDFSLGPLKPTREPTDLALRSEGFFVVKNGQETLLTRAGNFRLTARGDLVTQQGYAVLSDSGTPVQISEPTQPWVITPAGELRQGTEIQKLAIVKPKSQGDLVQMGQNTFRSLSQPQPIADERRDVLAGFLEMSGVQPTTEMVEMIEASRAFEANVNLMQTQDQLLGGLVGRLMRV